MEFPAGISGIVLMAIAILWLVFFIPSWSSSREFVELEKRMPKMVERNTVPSSLATQISRLQRTRVITAIFFAVFLLISVFSFVSIAASFAWLFAGIASLSLSLGAIALSKKAKQEIEAILESLLKRPQLKKAVSQKPAGWTPNPLPKPLIEEPVKTVSENVIELPKQKSSIDEIMRRRRVS
jgi:hypothetical protein